MKHRSFLTAALLFALGAQVVKAEPVQLSDEQLDRVTAGQALPLDWSSMDAFGANRPLFISGAMAPAPDVTRFDHWAQTVTEAQRTQVVDLVNQGVSWGDAMAKVLPWEVLAVVSGRGPGDINHALHVLPAESSQQGVKTVMVGAVPLPAGLRVLPLDQQLNTSWALGHGSIDAWRP